MNTSTILQSIEHMPTNQRVKSLEIHLAHQGLWKGCQLTTESSFFAATKSKDKNHTLQQ